MLLAALCSHAAPDELKLSIAMSRFTLVTADKRVSDNPKCSDILDLYVLEGGNRFFIGTGKYKLCDLRGTPKVTENGTDITIRDGENVLEITSGKLSMTLIVDNNIFQWSAPKNPAEFKAQVRKIAGLIAPSHSGAATAGKPAVTQAPSLSGSLSASELRDLKAFATMPLGRVPVGSVVSATDTKITELCSQYFPPAKTQNYNGDYYIRYPDGLDLTILGKRIGPTSIICTTKFVTWGGSVYFDNEQSAVRYFNLVLSGLRQCGFRMVQSPDYQESDGYLGFYVCESPGGQLYKVQTYCYKGYDGWTVQVGGSCLRSR